MCSVDDCPRAVHARGLCKSHYMRSMRRNFASDPNLPIHDVTSYTGAHWRVRAQRGNANVHPCQHCGQPAANWALNHGLSGLALLYDKKTGCAFSLNPNDYTPLCRSCHLKLDLGTGDVCSRGHSRQADAWKRPDGGWYCLACQRDRRRARQQERAQVALQAAAHLMGEL